MHREDTLRVTFCGYDFVITNIFTM